MGPADIEHRKERQLKEPNSLAGGVVEWRHDWRKAKRAFPRGNKEKKIIEGRYHVYG